MVYFRDCLISTFPICVRWLESFFHVKYGTTFLALDHFMNLSLNIVETQPCKYCVHSPLKCRVPDIFNFFAKKVEIMFSDLRAGVVLYGN